MKYAAIKLKYYALWYEEMSEKERSSFIGRWVKGRIAQYVSIIQNA